MALEFVLGRVRRDIRLNGSFMAHCCPTTSFRPMAGKAELETLATELSCNLVDWHNLRTSLQLIQIVRPNLHHRLPLLQKLRTVVGRSQSIRNRMCQLVLDYNWIKM